MIGDPKPISRTAAVVPVPALAAELPPPAPAAAIPVAERPIAVISLSNIQRRVQEQAKRGLRSVDDFSEGYWADEDRQHPRDFPAAINGTPVKYMTLPGENPYQPPYDVYAETGVPVTRDTVPGLPDGLFGVDGLVHVGGDVWYVFDKRVYDKIKERGGKRMAANVAAMAESRRYEDVHGGGVYSGIRSAKLVSV